jgi:hypothetical protein
MFFRNADIYLQVYTVLVPTRPTSTSSQPCEPQISVCYCFLCTAHARSIVAYVLRVSIAVQEVDVQDCCYKLHKIKTKIYYVSRRRNSVNSYRDISRDSSAPGQTKGPDMWKLKKPNCVTTIKFRRFGNAFLIWRDISLIHYYYYCYEISSSICATERWRVRVQNECPNHHVWCANICKLWW